MDRRHVAALSLALLLVVSGCSGLLSGDGTPADGGGATPTATPAPATPTPVPFTYPDGYSETGITDSQDAAGAHTDGALSHDSFTVSYRAAVQTPDRSVQVNFTQQVNTVERRAHLVSAVTGRTNIAQYYANDTVYVRSESPSTNQTSYTSRQQPLNLEQVTGTQFVAPAVANASYGEAAVVERDGETLVRYESQELTNATGLLGSGISTENVTSFSATLLVDEDGVVRRVEYRATVDRPGGERTLEVVVEVSELDSTTVQRPDWVDRAASS